MLTKILFSGNPKVPSDTLLALMDLSVGQVFNTNTFRQDVLKINNYYERIGYGGQVPTHVKDVNIDPQSGALTLTIQEGLVVKHIIIGGDPLLPPPADPSATHAEDRQRLLRRGARRRLQGAAEVLRGQVPSRGRKLRGRHRAVVDQPAGRHRRRASYNIYVARIAVVEVTGNTRTKDVVIRRELRERPGMVLNTDAIKRDYERLNALNFFSKVEPDVKPGPDPKKPQDVTLVWHVTEQRTAQASLGFGYSGGLTGLGLYGTLGFSDNNLHGTGNSAGIQFEEGARTGVAQLTASVPYLSNTPQGQKYTAGGVDLHEPHDVLLSDLQHRRHRAVGRRAARTIPIPVTLYPSSNASQISNVDATNTSSANGRLGQHRTSPERLHDPVALRQRAEDPLRHDRAVAVLLPRQSAEHLRRTDAQPDQLLAAELRRLVRHRGVVDRQRQHRQLPITWSRPASACRRSRSTTRSTRATASRRC